jgi:hypothetical protein
MGLLNSMKDGLKSFTTTSGDVRGTGSEALKELDTLCAIEAHIRWKIRLEAYLNGTSSEKLDPAVVEKDCECILGKWIYGVGGKCHGDHPEFLKLKDTHSTFHRCAADIVRMVDRGEISKAQETLHNGDYAKHSYRIKSELARLALTLDRK